jgi:hypothetical protein
MAYDYGLIQHLLERVRSASRVRFREVGDREGDTKLNGCRRNLDWCKPTTL